MVRTACKNMASGRDLSAGIYGDGHFILFIQGRTLRSYWMIPHSGQNWITLGEDSCSHLVRFFVTELCAGVCLIPAVASPSVDSECSVVSEEHRESLVPILVR